MDDQAARLLAGHIGVCALLVNVLIDKGVISRSELLGRFEQAQGAATQRSGGATLAHALAQIVDLLEPAKHTPSETAAGRPLHEQAILLVEGQPSVASGLQEALEEAGGEVLLARDATEGMRRLERFDVSAAVLDWRPQSTAYTAMVRKLHSQGVRFLNLALEPPETGRGALGAPILAKSAPRGEIVEALALLIGADDAEICNSLLVS